MKKFVLVVAFFGILGTGYLFWDVDFSCACIGKDDEMRMSLKQLEELIEQEKNETGSYPEFEKLLELVEKNPHKLLNSENKNTRDLCRKGSIEIEEGVYYCVLYDGNRGVQKGYILKGHIEGKRMMIFPVLVEIEK